MREILFRGKRYNGQWVYGNLIHEQNDDLGIDRYYITPLNGVMKYLIKSDTIGQYIGDRDTDGNRIFEGDIVETTYEHCKNEKYIIGCNGPAFTIINDVDVRRGGVGKTITGIFGISLTNTRVIGNIHDNPEIVEQMKKGG